MKAVRGFMRGQLVIRVTLNAVPPRAARPGPAVRDRFWWTDRVLALRVLCRSSSLNKKTCVAKQTKASLSSL